MPSVSIIIPTNRPPTVVDPCLHALARQHFDLSEIEVLLVYNGVTEAPEWPADAWPFELIVDHIEPAHIGAAKNVALARARGDLLLLLNDDVLPEPGFVAAHVEAHRGLKKPGMVLGRSDWRQYEDATLLDRMIAETSMVFFYDQIKPHAWHNFRHAWNLNLSLPRGLLDGEQFDEGLGSFFFEDIELAFRLEQKFKAYVWYEPAAAALHDHRYTLDGYLKREYELGCAAPRLWQRNPDCFRATYSTALDEAYITYCRQFVEFEGRREAEMRAQLLATVSRSPDEFGGSVEALCDLIHTLYIAHLPLKRLAFRRGLLSQHAARGAAQSVAISCPAF